MSLRWPVSPVNITQGFGGNAEYYKQFGQIGHNGIDIGVGTGTPVYAADDGTISFEGWGQNHSWMGAPAGICILQNVGGSNVGYAHLMSTVVNKGQRVAKGQLIGYSDSTGAATGPHLHFEMLPLAPNFQNGYAGRINLTPYIEVTQPAEGNKDMTPNFIRRAYYMIANAVPSQSDIDFHMSKSNPESFINGFGDRPLWMTVAEQRDSAVNERNALAAQRDVLQEELNSESGENTPLRARIAELEVAIADKDAQIADLKAHSGGVDQETKDSVKETNAIVKWVQDLLATVFNRKK